MGFFHYRHTRQNSMGSLSCPVDSGSLSLECQPWTKLLKRSLLFCGRPCCYCSVSCCRLQPPVLWFLLLALELLARQEYGPELLLPSREKIFGWSQRRRKTLLVWWDKPQHRLNWHGREDSLKYPAGPRVVGTSFQFMDMLSFSGYASLPLSLSFLLLTSSLSLSPSPTHLSYSS